MANLIQWIKSFWEDRTFGAGRDSRWPKVRKEYLAKYPFCEVCGTNKEIELHHCIPVHINKDLELSEDNFLTLCNTHHLWFGHLGSYRSWNENVKIDANRFRRKIENRP